MVCSRVAAEWSCLDMATIGAQPKIPTQPPTHDKPRQLSFYRSQNTTFATVSLPDPALVVQLDTATITIVLCKRKANHLPRARASHIQHWRCCSSSGTIIVQYMLSAVIRLCRCLTYAQLVLTEASSRCTHAGGMIIHRGGILHDR